MTLLLDLVYTSDRRWHLGQKGEAPRVLYFNPRWPSISSTNVIFHKEMTCWAQRCHDYCPGLEDTHPEREWPGALWDTVEIKLGPSYKGSDL